MCKCVEQGATDDRPYGIDVGKGTLRAPSPTHTNAKKERPMVAPNLSTVYIPLSYTRTNLPNQV